MLVSDFALAYEFTVDDTTRFLDCDPSGSALTCQKASTYDLVKAYAEVRKHSDFFETVQFHIFLG